MGVSTHQSRPRGLSRELSYVVTCLTERDRQVIEAVGRFGVFTAEHIAAMFFDSLKRAQVRLQRLYALRVLDRFQPYRAGWGSSPYHYILGVHGSAIHAATVESQGANSPRSRRCLALTRRVDLDALLVVHGFYANLVHETRACSGGLQGWMTQEEAQAWADRMVTPAGFGSWRGPDHSIEFFVEFDRGGPWLRTLSARLERYDAFTRERGASAWVLVVCSTAAREEMVCREVRLSDPVATATKRGLASMAEPWRVRDLSSRLRIRDLPPTPSVSESRRAWRYATPWAATDDASVEPS